MNKKHGAICKTMAQPVNAALRKHPNFCQPEMSGVYLVVTRVALRVADREINPATITVWQVVSQPSIRFSTPTASIFGLQR
jgi:hypothetical protein